MDAEEINRLKLWQKIAFDCVAAIREAYPPGEVMDTDAPTAIRRLIATRNALLARPEGSFVKGDPVLVAYDSGHLEECTVEEVTIWVKDITGHSHEVRPGQVSKLNPNSPLRVPQEREGS